MSSSRRRLTIRSRAKSRRAVAVLASLTGLVMVGSLLSSLPAASAQAAESVARDRSVAVGGVRARSGVVAGSQSASQVWSPPSGGVSWPVGSVSSVGVPVGSRVRAGVSPVSVGVGSDRVGVAPRSVRVEVFDQSVVRAAGVRGLLFSVRRADGGSGDAPVSVDVDYSSFAGLFGADWSHRLRLVSLPGCVVSTPGVAGCLVSSPVGSVNDVRGSRVSAQVSAAGLLSVSAPVVAGSLSPSRWGVAAPAVGSGSGGGVVYALTAGSSSDTGDFTQTPFSSSYSWQAGGSGADFSWSYPMGVPPVPGGLSPQVGLSYSSGAVDGQTAGANVQPGLLGEGWDFQPGFIDRSYRSCSDDQTVAPYYANATGDSCWRLPNARLVWGGHSSELIADDASGVWHAADDDGLRVERVSSDWSTANIMFSPGDFDGDGKSDVLYMRLSDRMVLLARGDGAGGWLRGGASTELGTFTQAGQMFSHGDFNGDAKPDVLWWRPATGGLYLISGDGQGGWLTGTSTLIGGFAVANLLFSPGDFDGDGKGDVIWRRGSDGALFLTAGNGLGGWKTGSIQIGTGWNSMDAIFSPGDFDGDGNADVITRNATSHNLFLYRGNGAGGWISGVGTQIATGPASADIIFSGGDHDGDAKADVLWRHATNKDVYMLAGNGTGGWKTGTSVNVTEGVRTGTGDDEYWKVTTVDGTQYFFGRSRMPGWVSGDRQMLSQWTTPVFANHSGEPCFTTAGFASSWCSQAWRWNLDYVVDRHGNSMAYFYGRNQGKVGLAGSTSTVTTYDRGGWIDRIEYGMRAGTELDTTTPPGKVVFTTAERCLTACWTGASWTSAPNTANWPDTPWDLDCQAAPCANNPTPTFWIPRRMSQVATYVWSGSGATYNQVDQWAMTHDFPATGNTTSRVLWLVSITHTGKAGGGTLALPSVTFGGTRYDNRADYDPNGGMEQPRKYRITSIDTETGGELVIAYGAQDSGCQFGGTFPNPDQNTKRCFPQYYTPANQPRYSGFGWWHKYIVTSVTERDLTGGSPDILHSYTYGFGGANSSASTSVLWHHSDGAATWSSSLAYRSWGDWRGYPVVVETTGPAAGTRSVTESVYLRGLHADRTDAGDGTRTSTLTVDGTVYTDHLGWAGRLLQQTHLSGPGGIHLTRQLHAPVRYQTASHTVSSTLASPSTFTAYINRAGVDKTSTWLAASSTWRTSTTTSTWHPAYGVISTVDDQASVSDKRCTRYTYAHNTTAYLIDFPSRVETVNVACAATPTYPANTVADARVFYDGATVHGTAPTVGDVTKTEAVASYTGQSPNYVMASTAGYDVWGRPTSAGDALGRTTTTAYTHNSAGLTSTVTVTNPLNHVTVTTVDPNRGQPLTVTDPNLKVTTGSYDALGRLLKVWLPGRATNLSGSVEYVYTVRKTGGVNAIETKRLGPTGALISSFDLYDGLLRARQSQSAPPVANGGRMITDTAYDGRGLVAKTSQFWNNASGPTSTLVSFSDVNVASQGRFTYDTLARQTVSGLWANNVLKWQTSTAFDGDRASVTPPAGGTATTTIVDERGRTVQLAQYQAATPTGPADVTTYGYDGAGRMNLATDPAGNDWSWTFDVRGRLVSSVDPDKGTTGFTYDDAGQLLTTTDARSVTLAYDYDDVGRRTSVWRDQVGGSGVKLAEWAFDTAAKGQLDSATRFVGGSSYVESVAGYDDGYRPTSRTVTLPASEGTLAGAYTTGFTYNVDGSLATAALPAAGGLSAETLTYGYDTNGFALSTVGAQPYVADTGYYAWGPVAQLTLGAANARVRVTSTMDEPTGRLTANAVATEHAGTPGVFDEVRTDTYAYTNAGTVTSIAETLAGATVSNQCFTYDYLQRLTEAWTTTATTCQTSPSQAVVGGPDAYWSSFGYNTVADRTGMVQHAAGGDTTTTYTYPPAGGAHPHALSSTATSGPGGNSSGSYLYDAVGDTTTRNVAGTAQTLTWDDEGHLASHTINGQTTSYVYTADGGRLLRRDPDGTTTAFLADLELRKAAGASVTATRYYGGVASRTAAGLTWLASDHHGTAQISINSTTLAVATRRAMPFGETRGTPPLWPNTQGFLAGTSDPTGLTHLGAREYDPSIGRFISVDPLMRLSSPQSWEGYAYAGNNPTTFRDPSGLSWWEPVIEWLFDVKQDAENLSQDTNGDGVSTTGDIAVNATHCGQTVMAPCTKLGGEEAVFEATEAAGDILGVNDYLKCIQGNATACGIIIGSSLLGGVIGPLLKGLGRVAKAIAKATATAAKVADDAAAAGTKVGKLADEAGGVGTKADNMADDTWSPDTGGKLPESWGPGTPNKKGVGNRWQDPTNPGSGVRIDQGNPGSPFPSQQVDHVIVRDNGKVIGRDGKPIAGSINEDPTNAHIPLSEWLNWSSWNAP